MTKIEGLRIGFIGLGLMGKAMARTLHRAGALLTVTNRSRPALDALAAEGMTAAATPRAVTEASEIIITMVTDTEALGAVLHGPDGVLAGLSAGALVIDMGTTKVRETREWAEAVRAGGAGYIDAPVSGGQVGAQDATLSIMVGAEETELARAMPVFRVLGREITHIGPVGSGQIAKAANQAIVGLTLAAVAEALTLAARAGADPAKVRRALMGGFAASRVLDLHGERMLARKFEPGGRASVQHKDIAQALELAGQVGLKTPSLEANMALWRKMLERGWGGLDQAGIIRVIEEQDEDEGSWRGDGRDRPPKPSSGA